MTACTPAAPGGRSLVEITVTHPDRQPAVASAAVTAWTTLRMQGLGSGKSYRASVGEVLLFGLLMVWMALLSGTTSLGFPATMAAASVLTAGPAVAVATLGRASVRTVPIERLPVSQAELVTRAVRHHMEVAAAADATGVPELQAAACSTQHGLWELAPLLQGGRLTNLDSAQPIVHQLEVVASKARETRQVHQELVDATSPGGAGGGPFVAGRLVASLARMQAAGSDLDTTTTALRTGAGVARGLDQTIPTTSRPDPPQSAVTEEVDGSGA